MNTSPSRSTKTAVRRNHLYYVIMCLGVAIVLIGLFLYIQDQAQLTEQGADAQALPGNDTPPGRNPGTVEIPVPSSSVNSSVSSSSTVSSNSVSSSISSSSVNSSSSSSTSSSSSSQNSSSSSSQSVSSFSSLSSSSSLSSLSSISSTSSPAPVADPNQVPENVSLGDQTPRSGGGSTAAIVAVFGIGLILVGYYKQFIAPENSLSTAEKKLL